MTSDYEKRRAEKAQREHEEDETERAGEIQIGETTGHVKHGINENGKVKIKMNEAPDMYFIPPAALQKGDAVKVTVKVNTSQRGNEANTWGRESPVLTGEATVKMTGHITSSHDIKIKIDHIDVDKFKPNTDIQQGDQIRIIVEKV